MRLHHENAIATLLEPRRSPVLWSPDHHWSTRPTRSGRDHAPTHTDEFASICGTAIYVCQKQRNVIATAVWCVVCRCRSWVYLCADWRAGRLKVQVGYLPRAIRFPPLSRCVMTSVCCVTMQCECHSGQRSQGGSTTRTLELNGSGPDFSDPFQVILGQHAHGRGHRHATGGHYPASQTDAADEIRD